MTKATSPETTIRRKWFDYIMQMMWFKKPLGC